MSKSVGILEPSRLMKRLLEGAVRKLSPDELSESINGQLSPEESVLRLKEFLRSTDYLDYVETRSLLLVEVGSFLESLRVDAIDFGKDRARDQFLRTLQLMLDQTQKQMPELDDMISKIGKAHAEMFVQAAMAGVAAYRAGLESKLRDKGETETLHMLLSDDDWAEIDLTAQEGARRALEMRVVEDD